MIMASSANTMMIDERRGSARARDPFALAGRMVALCGAGVAASRLARALQGHGATMIDATAASTPDLIIDCEDDADDFDQADWSARMIVRMQELRGTLAAARSPRLLMLADDRPGNVQGRARAALARSLAREQANATHVNIAAPAEGEWADCVDAIASLAGFLMSPHADFIVGHTFRLIAVAPPRTQDDASPGRVAIVTGAARGIGRAVADLLAAHDIRVHDVDLAAGCRHRADLSDETACRALVNDVVAQEGRLDALVNVAGWLDRRSFLETDAPQQRKVLGANFESQRHLCAAALAQPGFAEHGRIVNFTSGAGIVGGLFGAASYGFAKAASIALTERLAQEYGLRGARINALSPGSIDTPMLAGGLDRAALDRLGAATAIGRLGQPEDIAGVVLFLLSHGGGALNGHTVIVDGGSLMR